MNNLIHADIFFFVTTIFVAILAIFAIIAGVYAIKILKDIRTLVQKARIEGEFVLEEVREMRHKMHEQKAGVFAAFAFIKRIVDRYR